MYGCNIVFLPLTYGDYPKSMRDLVGKRLPKFTLEEAMMLKGSFDFLGLNYYTANFAADLRSSNTVNKSFSTDSQTNLTTKRNGKFIGDPTDVSIFYVYPRGLRDVLVYTKQKYKNPTIYITECGMGDAIDSVKNKVDVKGFFPWSFLDNFEWGSGYTQKFGLVYVDRSDGLRRYLKNSALWLKKFLQ
ncbi:Furcatin hydrolase [Olea europaea subsp. europaea]|uniref:Furcatin hydrolase n=1 Tax=Olea europaea subsp. europaea TaxID=158383 RepID=A0A8S0RFN1_OLEEU|nr:Furcatin hydrolase [Olea europaea subsp. europaea]